MLCSMIAKGHDGIVSDDGWARVVVEGFNEGPGLNAQDTLSYTGLIWACLISFCNGFFLGFKNLDRVIIHDVHDISGFPGFLPEGGQ